MALSTHLFCAFVAALLLASSANAALVQGNDIIQGHGYTTFQGPGETAYRIICQTPCPIPLATLQAASDGFRNVRAQLVALAGMDVIPALQPVDIAYEANSLCTRHWSYVGYSQIYFPYGMEPGQPMRGLLCLYQWEQQQEGSITHFTADAAHLPSSQVLALHEYGHVLFFERHRFSYEDFTTYWSFVISGIRDLPEGTCSEAARLSTPLVHTLCTRHGTSEGDLTQVLEALDAIYTSGQGFARDRTSLAQFRSLLDAHLDSDTSLVFLERGFTPQDVGRTLRPVHLGGNYWKYDDGLPTGAFWMHGTTTHPLDLLLEAPICSFGHPLIEFDRMFMLVPVGYRHWSAPLPPVELIDPLTVTYSYARSYEVPDVNPATFRLWYHSGDCGDGGPDRPWQLVPEEDAVFDHAAGTVTFQMRATGTYMVTPPDPVFRAGFE